MLDTQAIVQSLHKITDSLSCEQELKDVDRDMSYVVGIQGTKIEDVITGSGMECSSLCDDDFEATCVTGRPSSRYFPERQFICTAALSFDYLKGIKETKAVPFDYTPGVLCIIRVLEDIVVESIALQLLTQQRMRTSYQGISEASEEYAIM
ncbi:uncharacterized protein RAG0_16606 [Rhynchosporium agropyri]|uniref:Uncharacterized protein n=1 Tax=Rhynchosporium agropyri TaxID=914238 RepID=A0A1E1LR73_9HELO|nr:uncharacterized protein RAG0_16606 [Rhynchosporium agropyri]